MVWRSLQFITHYFEQLESSGEKNSPERYLYEPEKTFAGLRQKIVVFVGKQADKGHILSRPHG